MHELAREELPDKKIIAEIPEDDTLFLSPFCVSVKGICTDIPNRIFTVDGRFCAAYISAARAAAFDGSSIYFDRCGCDRAELTGKKPFLYLWEMINANGDAIRSDMSQRDRSAVRRLPETVAVVGNRDDAYVEDDVRIDPYVVFDTTKGPVYVSSGCEILPFTRIEGPCFIGRDAVILGARVREGCSIGEGCRIGGEVEDSVFYPYANKYHDGFIGHGCIGSFVNLGALCTNSDLRNDYSTVRVILPNGPVDTGMRKVGCFIGDHAKCSIGTLINTGTVIGPFAMTVQSGLMARKHLPPFSVFMQNQLRVAEEEKIDSIIESARTVMSRRNKVPSKAYENCIRQLFYDTLRDGYT